jgi:hypothetical protein
MLVLTAGSMLLLNVSDTLNIPLITDLEDLEAKEGLEDKEDLEVKEDLEDKVDMEETAL